MPKNEKAPERWMRKWEVDEKGETSVYAKDDFSGKENNFEGYSAKKKAMILRARRRIRMQAQAKQTRRATSPRHGDQDAEDRESWRELPGDLKPALKDVFRKCRDLHSAIAYHLQYTDLSNETYALGRSIAENCRVLWQQLEPFFYVEGPLAHGLSAGAQQHKMRRRSEDAPAAPAEEDYSGVMEQIKNEYGPRIVEIMTRIRNELQHEGFDVSEIDEFHDDNYAWTMTIEKENEEQEAIDIRFEILETTEVDGGMTFSVDVTSEEGHMIAGLTPYNYTDDVWVSCKDAEAVEERFKLIESADTESLIDAIYEYIEREW